MKTGDTVWMPFLKGWRSGVLIRQHGRDCYVFVRGEEQWVVGAISDEEYHEMLARNLLLT